MKIIVLNINQYHQVQFIKKKMTINKAIKEFHKVIIIIKQYS